MAYDFQVTVDCTDPHTLADWWAETLGWNVEPQDAAFIKEMIAKGYATDAETIHHNGSLVWRAGAAIRHPETGRRMLFQFDESAKTVKNRVHVDIRVGEENRDAERDRLVARGAVFLWAAQQGPQSWFTMADPEGNEFCIT
ncbi:VOC family protein [Actinoplanes utahensis]|uniref:Glyoxalase-like domain protein n=1 Tax=Actinoplanes utahensis TaxID=1869 RepID=A0A0A6WYF5_ACTUT|nr:VOC family protein [Actinoplanes utahensis]KHD72787.1 glyoxalase-like domain protein [Actinoplanes utahensis]